MRGGLYEMKLLNGARSGSHTAPPSLAVSAARSVRQGVRKN
jgi:hypothetical protein